MNIGFENEFVRIQVEEGIIFLKYLSPVLDLEVAKHVVETRLRICNGISYALLADISEVKTTTQ